MHATIDESLQASADVGSTTTWVLSNHDVMREVTRYALPPSDGESVPWAHLTQAPPVDVALGLRRARAAVLLLLGLPGSAYVYQGEELGLPEVLDLPEEALADPVWERSGHTERGRDGARVPIPWTTEPPSFGFSPPHATRPPWLPMPDWFGSLSVAAQTGVEGSTLELYRSALRLRREYGGDLPMSWADDAPQVLRFRLASGLAVQVNMSSQPVPIAPGRLRLASGPLDSGLLPPAPAVWVDQSA
jgi:alpha-glucosidase